MKNITTFEDLYSFIKDTLMGAEYEREMQVFGVTCDCYGNGMSIDDYRTSHTKDGICLSIQEGGLYEFVLAFWHINHTQNDQCFGLRFVIEPSETAWMTHEGTLEAMREFCYRYEDPNYLSQEMINNDPELRCSGFQPTVYKDLEYESSPENPKYDFEEIKNFLSEKAFQGGVAIGKGVDNPDHFDVIWEAYGVTIRHNWYHDYIDIVGMSEEDALAIRKMVNEFTDRKTPPDMIKSGPEDSEIPYEGPDCSDYYEDDCDNGDDMFDWFIKTYATPAYCNIISAMVCYMNGEFTREQTIADIMRSTDNNHNVKDHLEIILPHLDKPM